MNARRLMAMAVTTCAAGLSATACTAGISSAGQATSPSPAASRTASSPASPASRTGPATASPADTVSVGAPIGSFPIPHGAQVMANMPCGKQFLVEVVSVTPVQASTFYTSALPHAGYKITLSTMSSDPDTGAPQGMAEIMFTGHGYTGLILAFASLRAAATGGASHVKLPGSLAKNIVEISLSPAGVASTSAPAC
jgi:hypothetical protein